MWLFELAISFREHARIGVPVTLCSLLIMIGWIVYYSRLLKNLFFGSLRAINSWIADFGKKHLAKIVRNRGSNFRDSVN